LPRPRALLRAERGGDHKGFEALDLLSHRVNFSLQLIDQTRSEVLDILSHLREPLLTRSNKIRNPGLQLLRVVIEGPQHLLERLCHWDRTVGFRSSLASLSASRGASLKCRLNLFQTVVLRPELVLQRLEPRSKVYFQRVQTHTKTLFSQSCVAASP